MRQHPTPPPEPASRWRTPWAAAAALAALTLSGCAPLGVQPWERDLLAKPAMQPAGSAVVGSIDDHIYFSKEAATGGRATGGGGCGCN
jgi:transcriptional regulator of nitric oxide reductase